jgi:hypothetical protein|tara:strand:- start:5523 stop:5720 length:198 start_codon:yes stop_codon:yes gene_type:complete
MKNKNVNDCKYSILMFKTNGNVIVKNSCGFIRIETALKSLKNNTAIDELPLYLFQIRSKNKMCIS